MTRTRTGRSSRANHSSDSNVAPASTDPDARWGREDEPDAARERLLDAAGTVFARKGVAAVTVADVASAAGCTRGTVHRYFGDRDGLRRAFVEREAERVAERIAYQLAGIYEPRKLLVEGVLTAVREVRNDPVLDAWFAPGSAGTAAQVAMQAGTIRGLATAWVDTLIDHARRAGVLRPGVRAPVAAEGVVRVILSLLALPGAPEGASLRAAEAAERLLVTTLLAPALFTD